MWLVLSLMVGLGMQADTRGRLAVQPSDTLALRDSVSVAAQRFLAEWQSAWLANGIAQQPRWFDMAAGHAVPPYAPPRGSQYACTPRDDAPSAHLPTLAVGSRSRVVSARSTAAVCPSWFLGPGALPFDERVGIDLALSPEVREAIRIHRRGLIALLDSATRAMPGNSAMIGQLIRFLVDQGEFDSALGRATSCQAGRWWCSALTGYVLFSRGVFPAADSAFSVATASLTGQARCEWIDVGELLEPDARAAYRALDCSARENFVVRLWWLSDPLMQDAVNERRAEHYARRTQLLLKRAFARDERLDWRASAVADARAEMLMRYGWPSFISVADFLKVAPSSPRTAPANGTRFTPPPVVDERATFEYGNPRAHFVPSAKAIADPAHASAADWKLSGPALAAPAGIGWSNWGIDPVRKAINVDDWKDDVDKWMRETLPQLWKASWWPVEHSAVMASVTEMPHGQTAVLRRDHGAFVAHAVALTASDKERSDTSARHVVMLGSTGPESIRPIADVSWSGANPHIVMGDADKAIVIVGIESRANDADGIALRTRFGITPRALQSMKVGEIAISSPVILRSTGTEIAPDALPAVVLQSMAATDTVARGARVALYWETYGIEPTDSIDIALWIERTTPESRFRQLATSLHVATSLNTPVAINWAEARAAHGAVVVPGAVPIIGRHVNVDTSRLPVGDYRVAIAVQKPGRPVLRTECTMSVR